MPIRRPALLTVVSCLPVLVGLLCAGLASAASFDCAKAWNPDEKRVCASPQLSALDDELNRAWRVAVAASFGDARKTLSNEQRAWLKNRRENCASRDAAPNAIAAMDNCLAGMYRERIDALGAVAAFDSSKRAKNSDKTFTVLRVTPEGADVEPGRQVVIQFDQDVVAVGDMRRDAASLPVKITPEPGCEWRWINSSALACQLDEKHALKPATKYRVAVAAGLAAASGATMIDAYAAEFITQRPRIENRDLVFWLTPQKPVIRLSFSAPVTKTSVLRALTMKMPMEQETRLPPLDVYPDEMKRSFPAWAAYLGLDENQDVTIDDHLIKTATDEARDVWLVVPHDELPPDSKIWLMIAPGLSTPLGTETGTQKETALSLDTFPAFRFLGIRCVPNVPDPSATDWLDINYDAQNPPKSVTFCDPLAPVMLRFTSPVQISQIKAAAKFTPSLNGDRQDYDPWANAQEYTQRDQPYEAGREFGVWLPELLKAAQAYRIELPSGLRDEFGRELPGKASLAFRTSHRDPRLVIDYSDIVLEKGVDSVAAGYVTNIRNVRYTGTRQDAALNTTPVNTVQEVAQIVDISYRFAMMLRDILEGRSGVTYLCATTEPAAVSTGWRDNCLFAQVTPFAVHAKFGHFTSMVWVTDLATGLPVSGANVEVLQGRRDAIGALLPIGPVQRVPDVQTDADGIAALPGLQTLDPELRHFDWNGDAFVRVRLGDDIALLPIDGDYRANPGNGIWSDLQRKGEHANAWGFTAQGVYRSGETVDGKLWLRDQANLHWVQPAARDGYSLRVTDPTGTSVYSIDKLSLDNFGGYVLKFALAPQAVAGWYEVELRSPDGRTWQPLRFLVSDFTPAPYRTDSILKGDLFSPGDDINVTTRATLYSGGPFANAEARVTARITAEHYSPDTSATRGFQFGSWNYTGPNERELGQQEGHLDAEGSHAATFKSDDDGIYYGRLTVESAVMDDRGKYVTARSSALYVSRDRFVGLRTHGWLYEANKDGVIDLVVADPRGKLVADADITLALEKRVIRTARVQGPGDAYLLRNTGDWEQVSTCSVKSRTDSAATCTIHPDAPGDYRLLAKVKDTKGREFVTEDSLWVIGDGWVNWANDNDGGLEIVAEKDAVNTGETARYFVKNPYPGARALITVERYGVITRQVRQFNNAMEVIEIPVTRDMAPGFYLSVVVTSPRVDKPIEGEVDLGKPAFRMGYVKTRVTAPEKRIAVTLTTPKDEYRPRDDITAHLKAKMPNGAAAKPLSVAVVAIDESVLALNGAGAGYYDAEAGFNRLDSLDVGNWDLLMRLVGRQKIEKKGANPGGDGGGTAFSTLRDDFRYVALWQGDVTLDAKGEADVRFKAPDNLTGWRIFAIAVTAEDEFGLGQTSVKVNRPTEIRPAMPNQVMEGDRFTARFTVMNRTKAARTLTVKVQATGADVKPLTTTVALAPYEQKYVELPVVTKTAGSVEFKASAGDASDADALAYSVPVKARRIKEVAANYGTTTEATAQDLVSIPAAIYPDSSSLSVTLAPTVLGNLDGAFRYIAQYPYLCWEQRLSKALMFASTRPLKPWLDTKDLPADPDALVRDMLASAASFQAPNGGMTYWVGRDEYVSPYLSAYTALGFRWLARGGYVIPKDVETKLNDYLRTMLRTDVMPTFFDAGMKSSVRAVALAALSDSGTIDRNEVLRYASHMPEMSLFGKTQYLQALATTGAPAAEIARTTNAILGYGSQTGGKFQLLERLDDNYSEMLATPLRENCAALSALMRVATVPEVAPSIGDIPFRMVRMITQARGNRDHFENTQENVFCMNALYGYAKVYERETPAMAVSVRYETTATPPALLGDTRFNSVKDPQKLLRRALTANDPGMNGKITLTKNGAGRLYYSTRLEFAPKDEIAKSANAGIEVTREYSVKRGGKWMLLEKNAALVRGEIVRVDLFVKAPAARHYVVVDDPVPGLLEPVNTALATDSTFDDADAAYDGDTRSYWFSNQDGWTSYGVWGSSFYHREIRHDAVRFYSDMLPAGNYHLAYSAQVIATGTFTAQPTFAGEMYDIDVFGRGLPTAFEGREKDAGGK